MKHTFSRQYCKFQLCFNLLSSATRTVNGPLKTQFATSRGHNTGPVWIPMMIDLSSKRKESVTIRNSMTHWKKSSIVAILDLPLRLWNCEVVAYNCVDGFSHAGLCPDPEFIVYSSGAQPAVSLVGSHWKRVILHDSSACSEYSLLLFRAFTLLQVL